MLTASRTIETNHIYSVLCMSQDGKSIELETAKGSFHIESASSKLSVFVPKGERAQGLCYLGPLPTGIADWLMRDPLTQIQGDFDEQAMRAELVTVLNAHPSSVAELLDRSGIISTPIPNENILITDDSDSEISDSEDDSEPPTKLPARKGSTASTSSLDSRQ